MADESGSKRRGRTWEHEETLILLEKWGEDNIQERMKECTRKKPIWIEIANFLHASGYEDRNADSCKTRIHTLISCYRNYKDGATHTGNAPPRKPPFLDELDIILSEKPATKPVLLISSSSVSTNEVEDGDDFEESEDASADENSQALANEVQPPIPEVIPVLEKAKKDKKRRQGELFAFVCKNFYVMNHMTFYYVTTWLLLSINTVLWQRSRVVFHSLFLLVRETN